ncbi:PAS domain S-box protein [Chloroflexota bacterium]
MKKAQKRKNRGFSVKGPSYSQQQDITISNLPISQTAITDSCYRALVQNAMEGFWLVDINGNIIDVNDAFCQMLGYSRKELLSMNLGDIDIDYDSPEKIMKVIKETKKAGEFLGEVRHRCKDGHIIEFMLSSKFMDISNGLFFAFHRNITEEKNLINQLKESEERYRALIELGNRVGVAIVMLEDTDKDEAIQTFVSDEWLSITGYSRDELLGMPFLNLISPSYREGSLARHRRKLNGERIPQHFEISLIRKDGVEIPIEVTSGYSIFRGKKANVAYIRNVTERKETERARLESEQKYRDLYDNAPVAYLSVSIGGSIIESNKAAQVWLGYCTEELNGMNIFNIYAEESRPKVKLLLERFKQGKVIENEELVYLTKDKQNIYGLLSVSPVINSCNQVVASRSIVRDITERKKAEKELRGSHDYLKRLTNSMGDTVFSVKMPERIIEWVNDSIRLTGYEPEECIGRTTEFLYPHKSDFLDFGNKLKNTIASGKEILHSEQLLKRKSGEIFPVEITTTTFKEKGEVTHVTSIIRDITERKQIEEQLEKDSKHLEELVEERTTQLSSANKQLERTLQQQGEMIKQRADFTKALVHELKTPLTAVVSSSEVLTKQLQDKLELRLARNIYRSACNLDKRIDELLDLAKGEVGILKVTCKSLNPLRLIHEVVEDMTPEATRKGQSIILDVPGSLPHVWADRERIRQVFLNLISNALKFNSDKGRLAIRAREEGESIIFEIQDEGKGLTEREQERLFQPYYRIESDREQLSGLGLGLALSKKLVDLHQGQIWVKSRKGKGSVFGFSIPVATEVGYRSEEKHE